MNRRLHWDPALVNSVTQASGEELRCAGINAALSPSSTSHGDAG